MPLRFPLRSKAPGPSSTGAVQVWVGARPGPWRWLGRLLLVSAGLGGGLLLLGLSFRLGLRLMLNPEALPQILAQVLAQGQRSHPLSLAPAASFDDLRRQAEAAQQRLGDHLGLGDGFVLVPVLEAETETLVSLALFQRRGGEGQGDEGELSAIATLAIDPLPKDTVLAPFRNSSQTPTAVPATFPLTQVVLLPSPPEASEGVWLTLEGTWQQQGLTLRYGHLLHVDLPTQADSQAQGLTLLEPWSSPANRPPQWADLDGDGPSDLIIDETVGLEPALRGWQVMAGARPRLQPVSWLRVPVDAGAKAVTYQQALRLARGGLWHQALAHLADLKPALDQGWNPAAEAQLRLMERHAAITQRQAEQDWSTPAQYILALLIDGRWEAALAQLEQSPSLVPAVIGRLGADRGQMWNRISAAAALPDPPPAVYVWGGLAIKAQQNQPNNLVGASQDWLDRQPVPALARQRLATVLTALTTNQGTTVASARDSAGAGAEAIATVTNNLEAGQPFGAIALAPAEAFIGQGNPIAAPPAGYAAPGQSLDAGLGQWYAVDLRAVRQDQGWQRGSLALPPDTNPAAAWSVVQPAAQAAPQILRWVSPATGVTAPLTVRGLRLANDNPTLLATGPAVMPSSPPPLVFSEGALMWLDASQGQRPDAGAIAAAATAVFGGQTPPPDWATTLATQHRLDLTGDGQAERVLTWNQAALAQLQGWRVQVEPTAPKTIVLGQDNRVLYSDLFAPQTLVALTSPATGWPVGLLVYRSGGYDLLAWLAAAQRFE